MSRDASITFAWADGENRFRLAIGQLRELQEKTNAGPLELLRRIQAGTWRVDDLRETLRLGLIGGGARPDEALTLVRRYVDDRPWMESVEPAAVVLMAALVPPADEPVEDAEGKAGAGASETATASSSARSTEAAP